MVPPVAHGLVPARVTVRPGGDGSTRGSSLDGRDVVNRILSGVPKGLGQPLWDVAVRVIALLVAPAARGPTLVALEEIVTKGTPVARLLSRSEEHTSELQSHSDLVCRLLLEK